MLLTWIHLFETPYNFKAGLLQGGWLGMMLLRNSQHHFWVCTTSQHQSCLIWHFLSPVCWEAMGKITQVPECWRYALSSISNGLEYLFIHIYSFIIWIMQNVFKVRLPKPTSPDASCTSSLVAALFCCRGPLAFVSGDIPILQVLSTASQNLYYSGFFPHI